MPWLRVNGQLKLPIPKGPAHNDAHAPKQMIKRHFSGLAGVQGRRRVSAEAHQALGGLLAKLAPDAEAIEHLRAALAIRYTEFYHLHPAA